MSHLIDVSFDFRTDTPPGKDPDALSPTLRRYHKILWGRPLPDGNLFELDDSRPIRARYLYHASDLGEFRLASDSVIPSFTRWKRMQHLITQFPESENEAFRTLGYTIGGMMLWPATSTGGLLSINAARGFNAKIKDRMDLTLECVRRYYQGESSPMAPVLEANAQFFALFVNFRGFVEHFLLQDMVTTECSNIRFFTPFDNFEHHLVPTDRESYLAYRNQAIEFLHCRNERILNLAGSLSGT